MNKSNHELKIDASWERLQDAIRKAEVAYNNTVKVLQALGEQGVTKLWIGTPPEDGHEVTFHSLYTHKDFGGDRDKVRQHDILNRIGVGTGCSNGNGKQMQTQIQADTLVYGTYILSENGWTRVD
jgi:hypothetical protein